MLEHQPPATLYTGAVFQTRRVTLKSWQVWDATEKIVKAR